MNQTQSVLDTGHIGRLLFKLTSPIFFGLLLQNIYAVVDTAFVGRYVSSDGLAAISIILPIQMTMVGASNMVSVGGASLISRLIGQQQKERAERALGNSIFFALISSAVLTAITVPFIHFWLSLMGVSAEVRPLATDYLTIVMAGAAVNITGAVMLALLRAEGNAGISMVSMVIQSLLNIALDALFMIGLDWGIKGAALAMIISQGVSLLYTLAYYLMGKSYLKIRLRDFWPDRLIVKGILAIGASQFVKAIVDCISALVLVKMVARSAGDAGLSTFSIIQRVMFFAQTPSMVLGQAMQPILGFNYGARRFRQVLKTISLAVWSGTVCGLVAMVVLLIFPGPIIRLFTADPAIIDSTGFAFRLCYLGLTFFSFFNVVQLVFPSTGKAVSTLFVSFLRPAAIIIPCSLILPVAFGITGTWVIFPATDVLSFVLSASFLFPLVNRFRRLVRRPEAVAASGVND